MRQSMFGSKVCLDEHVVRLSLIWLNVKNFVLHELDYLLQFELLKTRTGTRLRKGEVVLG